MTRIEFARKLEIFGLEFKEFLEACCPLYLSNKETDEIIAGIIKRLNDISKSREEKKNVASTEIV